MATESTKSGTESNKVVQDPDEFFDGGERPEDQPVPKGHATKGMTVLGYTEASRIEDTATALEAEQKAAEKASAKEKD